MVDHPCLPAMRAIKFWLCPTPTNNHGRRSPAPLCAPVVLEVGVAQIKHEQLLLCERVQEPLRQLTADTTVARTAKRRQLVPVVGGLVDVDRPVRQRLCDAPGGG